MVHRGVGDGLLLACAASVLCSGRFAKVEQICRNEKQWQTYQIKIAAIDVDGTLFPGAIGACLFEELVADGVCRGEFIKDVANLLLSYRAGELAHSDMAERAIAIYAAAIAGVRASDVMAAAREVWRREESRLFPFAREKRRLTEEMVGAASVDLAASLAIGNSLGDESMQSLSAAPSHSSQTSPCDSSRWSAGGSWQTCTMSCSVSASKSAGE